MRLVPINFQIPVTDAQTKLFTALPRNLQSINIQVLTGSSPVNLGVPALVYGEGYPMIAGDVLNITWIDFDPQVRATIDSFEMWAICDTGLTATIQVFGWAKQ